MNKSCIGRQYPQTLKNLRAERKALLARLKKLDSFEDYMMRAGMTPSLEAVIPAKDLSQEKIKVSGNNIKTVVEEVIQEWERKHPKPKSSCGIIHIFLKIKSVSISISVHDIVSFFGVKFVLGKFAEGEIIEDEPPREHFGRAFGERG